jgi:hypothetical protein
MKDRLSRLKALDRKWNAADFAWQSELDRLFGDRAYQVRLNGGGEGSPGTTLADLFTAFATARDEYIEAMNHA